MGSSLSIIVNYVFKAYGDIKSSYFNLFFYYSFPYFSTQTILAQRKEHSLLYHNVPRITEHLASLSPSIKCQENLPSIAATTYMSTNFRAGDRTGCSWEILGLHHQQKIICIYCVCTTLVPLFNQNNKQWARCYFYGFINEKTLAPRSEKM